MANIGSTSASTAPVSSSSLSPPPTTYAPNVSSAERALATPQAQMASEVPAPSELKQRPRQPGQPNSGSDSSTGSDETLIPSTSDGQGTVQGICMKLCNFKNCLLTLAIRLSDSLFGPSNTLPTSRQAAASPFFGILRAYFRQIRRNQSRCSVQGYTVQERYAD
jgi:hypothetical protein